jgi:hypothetical protein
MHTRNSLTNQPLLMTHSLLKHRATTVPLVISTFGKLGPPAEGYLQNLASVACSTGVVDRGVWLRISRQYLSCALVRGRGIVFRHHYSSPARSDGRDSVMVQLCHLNDFDSL